MAFDIALRDPGTAFDIDVWNGLGVNLRSFSKAATAGSNAGSLNITLPADIQEDDLIVIVGTKNATGDTWSTPSGYTLWQSITNGTDVCQGVVYYKVADGTEGGTTVNVNPSSTNTGIGAMAFVWINVKPSDPIDSAATTGAWDVNAVGPDPTTNSITTDHDGAALLHIWVRQGSRAGFTVDYGGALKVIDENNSLGATVEQTMFAAWELKATAGATTARTLDTTGGTNVSWDAVIALRDVITEDSLATIGYFGIPMD